MTAVLRRLTARPGRLASRVVVGARTRSWPPYSHLFVLGDRGGWSVDEDADHVSAAARRLGCRLGPDGWAPVVAAQSVFHTSHFEALSARWRDSPNRIGLAYMHGRPGTAGMPEFDAAFEALRARAERIARVQVTHGEMEELVTSAGVPPERLFRIPLGIDLENFPLVDEAARRASRAALGLPESAFLVGSFQKDGVGWGEGLEPKLIKGPDLLVRVLAEVQASIPDLFVLLTGPARGYVRRELEPLGVPYRHLLADSRRRLAQAYHALDLCLVTSRQEGGPKAVLESMAAGVPLVCTRVGQAAELVEHGVNAALVDVEDVDALVAWTLRIREDAELGAAWQPAARATAEAHAHERLDARWAALLDGFVERSP
jgi:glycosyltransferase involved in cell wall biosynthesis